MLLVSKRIGETPLQLLDRLRIEQPELASEKLSYAGRLDPMAEGEMLILVGDENKHREQFLGFDKEYEATFIIGMTTDTGDLLGLVSSNGSQTQTVTTEQIMHAVQSLTGVTQQQYPWFSGKTVRGVKLFDYFKTGMIDIERPTRHVSIFTSELLKIDTVFTTTLQEYLTRAVQLVHGDFRQNDILKRWHDYCMTNQFEHTVFTVKLHVSSGTYIRGLTESFPFPVTLFSLRRTKIYIPTPVI